MKKLSSILFTIIFSLIVSPAWAEYRIINECDTTVKARLGGSFSFGSREVKHIVYEYPSTDADGQPVTISGVIMIPSDIINGSTPCDGVIMYNHPTIGSPEDALSVGGSALDAVSGILSNPLRPNYIVVASDYIGYGSSIDHPVSYISGDTNARNCLDGLLAARQLFEDQQVPQGKFLFNLGYSQGGLESMYAARLCDTDEKYRDIRFDKTFSGGGALDIEKVFTTYIERDRCDGLADVVLMIVSVNENYHLGIPYDVIFKEPMASKAKEYFEKKTKSVVAEIGVTSLDSISQVLQPGFMDLESDAAKKFVAKLQEISVTHGWEPDVTKNYYIAHSRHDNYVPIQSGRGIIPWMRDKGFQPSIVPGKTSLQTCTAIFKLKHQQAAIVWAIQAFAAIQVWPVMYYEGEQNRYYHNVVKDLNLMKAIKFIESLGIDLKKIVQQGSLGRRDLPTHITAFDVIPNINDILAKVDLTTDDLEEMCEDAGITQTDLVRAFLYLKMGIESAPETTLEEKVEGPLFLLRTYEKELASWFLMAGYDVNYELWGM
ncbi:MAG: hypothetical protein IKR50_04485 [Prevotella sp.]|nr:hypothetical protein [Prevotella sp.]